MKQGLLKALLCASVVSVSQTWGHPPNKLGTPTPKLRTPTKTIFAAAELGVNWQQFARYAVVDNGSGLPQALAYDLFRIDKQGSALMSSFLFGLRLPVAQWWVSRVSLAIRYRALRHEVVKGEVFQFSQATFNNYRFAFERSSEIVSLVSKVSTAHQKSMSLYLRGGIGLARNHINWYREYAKQNILPRVNPGFMPNNNTQTSYSGGLGVDIALKGPWALSLGYEYQGLGRFVSGFGSGAWRSELLNLGRSHSQMLVASISIEAPV